MQSLRQRHRSDDGCDSPQAAFLSLSLFIPFLVSQTSVAARMHQHFAGSISERRMPHLNGGREFHLILLPLMLLFTLASSQTTKTTVAGALASPAAGVVSLPSSSSSPCDASSPSCVTLSQETSTRIQQLKDSNPTRIPVETASLELNDLQNETEAESSPTGTLRGDLRPAATVAGNASRSRLHLRLPSLSLPQRDFFSISDRILALKNLFQSIVNMDSQMIWNPIVPSRMSRGSFLVSLFSNLLKIMPFQEVSRTSET